MSHEQDLPPGWVWTSLGEICFVERGITFPSSAKSTQAFNDTIACLRTTNVQKVVNWDDLIYIPKSYVKDKSKLVQQNDILISTANSRELVGKVAFVDYLPIGSTLGGFISVIRVVGIEAKFLFYYLRLATTQKKLQEASSQTVNLANISLNDIYTLELPLSPLPEQQRIVEAIEQQLTLLDASIAALQQDRIKLKNARASVLKYAVEGKLSEEWRAEYPAEESAQELLARILRERRARWEAEQLAKMQAKGVTPKDDGWKKAYKEPVQPDTEDLGELPEGWCWASVDQIGDASGGVTKGRNLAGRDIITLPYLRVANVQRHFLDLRVIKTIEIPVDEVERYLLKDGDVLMIEGGDADKLGRAAIWRGQIPQCIHQNHIFRVRFLEKNMSPSWLVFYANSKQGQAYFLNAAKQTVNLASINLTQLRYYPIPLPPLAEQQQIVSEVEMRLSLIEQAEKTIEESLLRAERVRQSILRQAFAGKLVPQDADDEPADVLLERIREERERRAEEELARRKEGRMQRAGRAKGKKKITTQVGEQEISLVPVLVEAQQPLEPDAVYKRTELEPDEVSHVEVFFEVLGEEEDAGYIHELRAKRVAETPPVLLEATPQAYALVAVQEAQEDSDSTTEIEREE